MNLISVLFKLTFLFCCHLVLSFLNVLGHKLDLNILELDEENENFILSQEYLFDVN